MEYKETNLVININGISIEIPELHINGRIFWNYKTLCEDLLKMTEEEMKKELKYIPNSYKKKVNKIDYIDVLYINAGLIKYCKDYNIYKKIQNMLVLKPKDQNFEYYEIMEGLKKAMGIAARIPSDEKKIKNIDDLQQDILHNDLDNKDNSTDEELLIFAKNMKVLRDHRRLLKNKNGLDKIIGNFIEKHKVTAKDIDKLYSDLIKLDKIFKNKIYNEKANNESHEEWKELLTKVK